MVPPDATINYAMDQMRALRQPDESSETYARCQATVQCICKILSRGDAVTKASETISQITSIYPPPQCIPLLNEWNDHISYQRLREDDLCQNGELRIEDQGMRFVGHRPVGHERHHFTAIAGGEPDPGDPGDEDDEGNNDQGQNGPHRPIPHHKENRGNPPNHPRGGGGDGGDGGGGRGDGGDDGNDRGPP
jgi:hypothetical protein